ncbi:hypothetical protein D779_2131 [Imhoffiella purpurea]|uniref:Uncharacterized protein n=1 Tax=Imhoffiella purpurea TaxID=1249627 RepID=W9VFD5_9GAMM|nr:hypothetical protein D779_2131 [Imhoffiella purpurea]
MVFPTLESFKMVGGLVLASSSIARKTLRRERSVTLVKCVMLGQQV